MLPPYFSVKEAVFPFVKFPGVDTILGPEMKSTGEVMGVGLTFGEAFVKSQLGAGTKLPRPTDAVRKVFLTVKNADKPRAVEVARHLVDHGFELVATKGTAAAIAAAGLPVVAVNKVTEGRPHVVDMIKNNEIALVINTVEERRNAIADSRQIRISSLLARVTTFTTIAGAEAAVEGMKYLDNLNVYSLQELHTLKTVDRPWVINAIAEARAQGDLSENAEYDAAKDRQGFIEGRIQEIESKLSMSQIIDPANLDAGGRVVFGATVELEDEATGDRVTYQIVGEDEADLKLGLINISSPIARALIGKEEGDIASVQAPGGVKQYEIIKVSYV
ncbi:MAG: transcription elongation factor GreA [Betaproteobacteria bacterium]|nr:transcription elongation factor GreA [Betaproteobacteria bacterium]